MKPYIALAWPAFDPQIDTSAKALTAALLLDGAWTTAFETPGLMVLARPQQALQVRCLAAGRGVLIGDLFDKAGVTASARSLNVGEPGEAAQRLCEHVLGRYWGRYIILLTSPSGVPDGVFRDPSGAVECACWSDGGVMAVSNDPPDGLLAQHASSLSIDWDALGAFLDDPSTLSTRSGLRGLHTVTPGALRRFGAEHGEAQLWRPQTFAAHGLSRRGSGRAPLASQLDQVVGALSTGRKVLAEVSGGLDSALVASALTASDANVRTWVTFVGEDLAADERAYARAVGAALGFSLTEVSKGLAPVTPDAIAPLQSGVEPSLNALDCEYDHHVAALIEADSIDAVFTGFGGDAAYFQMADPAVVEDLVARLGRRGLLSPAVGQLARWTRRSAYGLLRRGLWPSRAPVAYPTGGLAWRPERSKPAAHPWTVGMNALPPAKRLHILALTHMLSGYGRSRRSARAELIHPHLTQPMLELMVGTPVDLLVEGGRDRAMAREAFRGRLPDLVLDRRSKGDLGVLHAQNFVAGLPTLRPFLLEGLLAQHKLIDPARLSQAMDPGALAQHGGHIDILHAVAIEAWARHWKQRLEGLRRFGAEG
jgi:asparagine synthase (glutamine-hydrolysing)